MTIFLYDMQLNAEAIVLCVLFFKHMHLSCIIVVVVKWHRGLCVAHFDIAVLCVVALQTNVTGLSRYAVLCIVLMLLWLL